MLGVYGDLTKEQKTMINSWLDTGFNEDMISKAGKIAQNKTGGKSSPLPYINGILKRWAKSGIFTVEQAENDEKYFDSRRLKAANEKETSFSIEKWEEMTEQDPRIFADFGNIEKTSEQYRYDEYSVPMHDKDNYGGN